MNEILSALPIYDLGGGGVRSNLAMPVDAIIVIATLVLVIISLLLSWLVLTLLIRVVRASLTAVIGIGAVVLILQLVFGVSLFDLWLYITQSFQSITQGFQNITQSLQTLFRILTGR